MKCIPGYEGKYSITDGGKVYSHARGIYLKPDTSGDGYEHYTLCKEGKTKRYFGHRLMMMTYDCLMGDKVVNHKDGDKRNNCIDNLEWVTVGENNAHAYRTGLKSRYGEKNHQHKLTEDQVKEMRALRCSGVSTIDLAIKYGVKTNTVSRICNRRRWKHIE